MKKFSLLMAAALIAVSSVFVACNKEEADGPKITVYLNGTAQTAIEVAVGTPVEVKIEWEAAAEIKQIDLEEKNGSNLDGFPKTKGFRADDLDNYTFTAGAAAAGESVTYLTKVTDKDARTANKEIVITYKAASVGSLGTFANVKIFCTGADGTGSSAAASSDGTTFKLTGASTAQQQKCDFVYFWGKMYSPATISGATGNLANIVNAWTTKNATKFTSLVGADFASVTAATIADLVGTPAGDDATVALNSVVGFKTAAGKVGVFKVVGYQAGYNPTDFCTIDIKVLN